MENKMDRNRVAYEAGNMLRDVVARIVLKPKTNEKRTPKI